MSENRAPKKSDARGIERAKSRSRLSEGKIALPWWVELFFVQIGLPENLLRKSLKTKKLIKKSLNKNINTYKYLFFALLIVGYINPIIKESRNNNICIDNSQVNLSKRIDESYSIDKRELKAIAIRYCNGGYIGFLEESQNK